MENRLVATGWKGESGTNWKGSIGMDTLPCVSRELVTSCCAARGLSSVLCDGLERWDGGGL